jgi:hypothetical protein
MTGQIGGGPYTDAAAGLPVDVFEVTIADWLARPQREESSRQRQIRAGKSAR